MLLAVDFDRTAGRIAVIVTLSKTVRGLGSLIGRHDLWWVGQGKSTSRAAPGLRVCKTGQQNYQEERKEESARVKLIHGEKILDEAAELK
jgi:hypothetical protein